MGLFYKSEAWRTLRIAVLRRDRWRCVVCGIGVWGKGQSRVDHIVPIGVNPHLALEPSNCRTLCARCDNQSHREKGGHNRLKPKQDNLNYPRNSRFTGCDADGWPLEPR